MDARALYSSPVNRARREWRIPCGARPTAQGGRRAEPALCRALVQAMSELAPSHVYRINPDPEPPRALRLDFEMAPDGTACLSWPGGKREISRAGGHTDTQIARIIVAKSGKKLEKL
ncbi:hypothetical protein [Parasedimentitalea maritima]|uniref:Uncharacterized protein n=1 Tax=Parasedimentitalea maritima TaxID=2578117 RepID=A0A6A4RE92_9RHOB|nr:hypothetical protein [Zongyanglinia marina]KAE9629294.1 hypothetical protein GP644_12820 [Zongyanglinia marina]